MFNKSEWSKQRRQQLKINGYYKTPEYKQRKKIDDKKSYLKNIEKRHEYGKNRYWFNKINNTEFHKKELERKRLLRIRKYHEQNGIIKLREYRKKNPQVPLKSYLKSLNKISSEVSLTASKYSKILKYWSLSVKKRDDYTCQICECKNNLISHHIFYKALYPKLSLNINNGITLCRGCHYEIHGKCIMRKVM